MKTKLILILSLVLIISLPALSQSVYHFQYKLTTINDPVTYHSILIKYDDGSGFLRVRYVLSGTEEDRLVEMDIEEYPIAGKSGSPDSSKQVFKTTKPRVIYGTSKTKYELPVLVFTLDSLTGFFEPSGIWPSQSRVGSRQDSFLVKNFIEARNLSKELMSNFFMEDEDFYKNFYRPVTRGLDANEKNIKLHLLVVADTLDKEIGASCSKDMQRTMDSFTELAEFLGIKIFTKAISGADFSKKNVQDAINKLKPAANDIVVFYYSGHGFRKPGENRRFPHIKLKTDHKNKQDVLINSMNMEDIFLSIKKKGARFNLVLSDCCNDDILSTNSIGGPPGLTRGAGLLWSENNCKALFLNKNPMSILATAADYGQRASSNNNFGGFFSHYFKTSMEEYFSLFRRNVTWDQVLQDAKTQTIKKAQHTYCAKPYIPENICHQYPYYKIVFGK